MQGGVEVKADTASDVFQGPELMRQALHQLRDERDQAVAKMVAVGEERDEIADGLFERTMQLHRLHVELKPQGICTGFYLSGRVCDECRTVPAARVGNVVAP